MSATPLHRAAVLRRRVAGGLAAGIVAAASVAGVAGAGPVSAAVPVLGVSSAVTAAYASEGTQLQDSVTVSGNDGGNGTITGELYSVALPTDYSADDYCQIVPDASYRAGAHVGTYTAAIDGSVDGGNGTFVVAGPEATAGTCYHWFESVALQGGATATGPADEASESTLVGWASLYKLTAGREGEGPKAATFDVTVASTGAPAGTFSTIAGAAPTRLVGFVAGTTYLLTETTAPAGAYIPSQPFEITIPKAAPYVYSLTLFDPAIPDLSITTAVAAQIVSAGGPLIDNAALAGNDGEDGTITDELYSIDAPPGATLATCQAIPDATYQAGTHVGTYTAPVDGSVDGGNGTFPVTGPPAQSGLCYHWFESVVLPQSGATATGAANQTAETVLVGTPVIISVTTNPVPQSVTAGQPATFTAACTADQGATVAYQWQVSTDNGASFAPIDSATSASYTIGSTTLEQNGSQYRALCSAPGAASATTSAATLTVTAPAPATFVVTTLNSTGTGSLAAAIDLANASSPSSDTITFAPGLTGAIEMPEGVTITDSVTITGPGRDALSLSGGGTHQILILGNGFDAPTIDVAISGLTLTKGTGNDNSGGAMYAYPTNLTLTGDSFTGNEAGGYGGAVFLAGGSLDVEGTDFAGNTSADGGGAVLVFGTQSARIAHSAFTNNTSTATFDDQASGGAIISIVSNLAIDASTFTGNSAGSSGGAISAYGNTLTISGSEFDGNTATAGNGGALAIGDTDSVAISASTLAGNTAGGAGGAIAMEDRRVTGSSSLTVTDSTITANTARGEVDDGSGYTGGTIALISPIGVQLDHVTMTGNTSTGGAALDAPQSGYLITNSALFNPGSQGEISAQSGSDLYNTIGADPQLGPLQDNGGPTRTMLPLPGSPLIDTGDPDFPTGYPAYATGGADQRGLDRVVRTTDQGAVEVQVPVIAVDTQPASVSVTAGQPATFTAACTATEGATIAYQWQVSTDGGQTFSPIAGAANTSYTIGSTTLGQSGNQYRVLCTAPGATSVTSTAAALTVTAPAPVITVTTNPASQSVTAGQPATFAAACTATEGATVAYQWQESTDNGGSFAPIADATSASYTIGSTALKQNGNQYRVECSAPGATAATSTAATLTVTAAPTTPPTTTPPTTTPPTGTAPTPTPATTSAAQARSLASTGAATNSYLPLGIGILALGAVMVAMATRRRQH